MLVNTLGAADMSPCTGLRGECTLADYKAWRELAVAMRQSAIDLRLVDALPWLREWADPDSVTQRALLVAKADPDVEAQKFPELPDDPSYLAGLGTAKVFTEKVPELVNYLRRGDALIPDGEGTRALRLARERKPGRASGNGVDYFKAVGITVVGGVLTYALVELVKALRGRD